jgi:hypothetical protein
MGDLVVNAALNLAGSSTGGCGGSATLGAAVGTGNVTLSSSPINASSDSCGMGMVVVTADEAATVSGEINADSNGTTRGGGFIAMTADLLTVRGMLHANGGGGEINLRGCDLTLAVTGQAHATGPNGFTLLQASGAMEIDGSLIATSANTLDYLAPAQPPIVRSSNIAPPAMIVQNIPPVPLLCPAQTTTTVPTTATTSPAPSVTSTLIGDCSPPSCDDRGPCMPGTCVAGRCEYMAVTGVDCAKAALREMNSLVDHASLRAFKGRAIRGKLMRRLAHLGGLVANVSGRRARAAKAKRRAAHAFASFGNFVDGAARHQRIDSALTEHLNNLSQDAESALGT